MSDDGKAPDAIDAAIEAATEPPAVQMASVQIRISSTGRPFALQFPADMTDSELAEATGWMLTTLLVSLRTERAKTAQGRIIVPGGLRLA